ncbi:MAG TPA: T9SS type A sorting domain-containing protein, partial [Ignavibacteriales bacterium]|nr:T9SS type A sorting domain-containing protein [Ignavibacteriales bacterium]
SVYLIGGDDIDGNMSNSIFKYNPAMKTWEKLSYPMHKSLHYFNAVQIGGKIYMGGGQSKLNTYESSFVSLDLETEEYTELAAMPSRVYGYALGTYGDSLIYIMGGCTDVNPGPGSFHFTTAVQVYNIKTNEWKLASPFTGEPRMSIAGAICGNTIVLAGGYGDYSPYYSNAVDVGIIDPKDPYTIAWGQSEYPAGGFSQLMSGSWEGEHKKFVYFTGGYAKNVYSMGDVFSVKTWIYDVQQNTWLAGPDKISHVENPASLAMVVRNDSVFMAAAGGLNHIDYTRRTPTELLYIGKDEPYDFSEKDAAAVSIDVADTLYLNKEITPAASFTNKRPTPQIFSVTMEITPGSYKRTAVVSSLEYNSVRQVSFPKWTPDAAGTYAIKVYLSVGGDNDKSNDTLTSVITVRNAIGIWNEDMAPAVYSLSQNYPNPFNPATVIKYSIAEAGKVELKIYNMLGQEIKTLVNDMKNAGRYEVKFNASGLSSGVYIYRIKSGSFVQTKKLMLIK